MTRTRKVLLIATGLLLLSGTAWSMRPGSEGVSSVRRGDVVQEVVAPGVVEPEENVAAIGFETAGRIAEITVREGDAVEVGDIVARLDDRMARAHVARAEAALAGALARRDLAFHGARPAEIRAAEADAEAARAQARDRELTRERTQKLIQRDVISRAEADGAEHAAAAAKAASAAADARLSVVRQGDRAEQRRSAAAAVAAAEAELEQAKTLLAQTELRSPRAGVVVRKMMEVGEQVTMTPPRVVVTIADLDRLVLRAEVDEADVGRIEAGQAAYLTADAYGSRRFPARVVRRIQELGRRTVRLDDPHAKSDTRVLEVILELEDASELPIGLRMDAHIETVARRNVLTVPGSAVRSGEQGTHVMVLDKGRKVSRPVEIGLESGKHVEIVAGVSEGEVVSTR
jgi:HlyD family secretion protein